MISKKITNDAFDDIVAYARRNNQCLTVLMLVIFLANSSKIKTKHNHLRKTYVDYNQKIFDQRFIPCIDYQGNIDNKAVESGIDNLPEDKELYLEISRKHCDEKILQILENDKRNFIIILK